MNSKNQTVKKVLATTLAANMLLGGAGALTKEVNAWDWPWSSKHTQEDIDSIYHDVEQNLKSSLTLSKDLDDTEKAESFIKSLLDVKDSCEKLERTYKNAQNLQKKVNKLKSEVNLAHDLQEIERKKKLEIAKQEEERLENDHRRQMEIQRLQMEKEERERLELINNAKSSLNEKFLSIKRKILKNIELPENLDHVNALSNEIEEKIQLIDNLNRVEGIEALITEFLEEVESIMDEEAKIKYEEIQRQLSESKEVLNARADKLQDLLSNEEDESFTQINNEIKACKEAISSLDTLDCVDELQSTFDELEAEISYLIEMQAQKEAERVALEELEREIENSRDPQVQLEMLSEGKIKLDDVIGGNQKAKSKAIALIKAFERYNKGGKVNPSKGLLLYGPPGTGKTSFVNAFAAEQGLELFFVNPSLVMGDNGERKVLETFEQAKKSAQVSGEPVILLIDEIDAVAQKRSSSSSDKVLVMLMNEIDKLKASDDVIIFATTNRREALDSAIIRSGRLDQSVEVGLPNAVDKEKIVNIYLKNLKVADNLNISAFVDKMKGFCGADIKRVIDVAINSAMERNDVVNLCDIVIGDADLQEGIATIMDEKVTAY